MSDIPSNKRISKVGLFIGGIVATGGLAKAILPWVGSFMTLGERTLGNEEKVDREAMALHALRIFRQERARMKTSEHLILSAIK